MTDLEAFYRQHIDTARRFAHYVSAGGPDVDDLAHDALQRCALRQANLKDGQRIEAYLYRTITRLAIDRFRSDERRRRRELAVATPERHGCDSVAALEHRLDMAAALSVLTIEQRSVVVLRYWVDMSEAEIANTLKIRPGTVKSRLNRALATLRPIVSMQEAR